MAVMLTNPDLSRTELAITENISVRGARVLTKIPWSANDSLVIKSLEGTSSQRRGSSTVSLYAKMSMLLAWS